MLVTSDMFFDSSARFDHMISIRVFDRHDCIQHQGVEHGRSGTSTAFRAHEVPLDTMPLKASHRVAACHMDCWTADVNTVPQPVQVPSTLNSLRGL